MLRNIWSKIDQGGEPFEGWNIPPNPSVKALFIASECLLNLKIREFFCDLDAQKFKAKFEECQSQLSETTETNEDEVAEQLGQLTVSSKSAEQDKTGQTTDEKEKAEPESKTTESQETTEQDSRSTDEKEKEKEEPTSKAEESQEGTEQDSRTNSDVKTETEGSSHSPDQS